MTTIRTVQTKIDESPDPTYYNKVRNNADKWKKFNNSFAYNIASSGIYLSFKKDHKKSVLNQLTKNPKQRKFDSDRTIKIEKEINKLLELKILEINKTQKIFPNHVFILSSEHRSTKDRLIFDMSVLNKSINKKKFSMTGMSEIIPHIFENEFACSFDISKAYYHVPINPKYSKYFSFPFNNQNFSFRAMPFGLCTAPYLFTKFISPILEHLRILHKIIIFSYLDDFLLLDKSETKLAEAIKITISTFEDLGFLINKDKSILIPTSEIQFLGVNFHLKKKTMSNSERLINKMMKESQDLIDKSQINRLQLEKFIGLANFMSGYMSQGRHHLHPVIKISNSYIHKVDRYQLFSNRSDLQKCLVHWTKIESFQEIPISKILPQISLEVDSSNKGWGAALVRENHLSNYQGDWSPQDKSKHINLKELLGILKTLEAIPEDIKDFHISISNDNKTTVATLKKLGSNRSAIRQKITSQILQELTRRNCTFEVHHIPGKEIVLADFMSRNNHLLPTEVQISQEAFHQIMKELDLHPEVDLFSTRFNNKLPNYHSAIQDCSANHINTLTANWADYQTLYAFPPPILIHKILYKWQKEKKGTLILVAPNWPTKSWYSSLHRQTQKTIKLNLGKEDLFIQTKSGRQFIENNKLHLTVHLL